MAIYKRASNKVTKIIRNAVNAIVTGAVNPTLNTSIINTVT